MMEIFSNLYMVGGQEPRIAAQQKVDLLELLYFCWSFLEPGADASRRNEEFLLQSCQSSTAGGPGRLEGMGNVE